MAKSCGVLQGIVRVWLQQKPWRLWTREKPDVHLANHSDSVLRKRRGSAGAEAETSPGL